MRKLSLISLFAFGCGTTMPGSNTPGNGKSAADLAAGTASVCGNGVLEAGEQCDDGNVQNLDGCNSTCGFEQVLRANSATLETTTDALCPNNAIGAAVANAASQLQPQITDSIQSGDMTLMVEVLGLTDLTGQSTQTSGVTLGALNGAPVAGANYNGTSDLDWWYNVDPSSIDANRNPIFTMTGTLTAEASGSTAGAEVDAEGTINVPLGIGDEVSEMHMSSTKIRANVGAASAPTPSASGSTPGHLASEHDATLSTFASVSNGELCGNASAASLAQIAIPALLLPGNGLTSCGGFGSPTYTADNTLLDVVVNGCSVAGGFVTAVSSTQPDQIDPSMPAAGAGGPYKLTSNSSNVVTGCQDKNGASVDLQTCLNTAAYSVALTFTMDRVIAEPPLPASN